MSIIINRKSLAVALTLTLPSTHVLASSCTAQTNFFINENALYQVSVDDKIPVFTSICQLDGIGKLNSLAYNSDDGLLYAVRNNASESTLVSIDVIDSGCVELEVGAVGQETYAAAYSAGEYVFLSGKTLYRYSLYPFELIGQLVLSEDIEPDFFYSTTEQRFHVMRKSSNELAKTPIFPWEGIGELTSYGSAPLEQSGAMFIFNEKVLYGFMDETASAFSYNLETQESNVFSNVFPTAFNKIDAASCFGFENNPPFVQILAPREYSTSYEQGESIFFEIVASDNDFADYIATVELYETSLEGGEDTKIGTAYSQNRQRYYFSWNDAPKGTHAIYAVAKDRYDERKSSQLIQVVVDNAPTAKFVYPLDGMILDKGRINVEAIGSDNTAIKKMRFYVNNELYGIDSYPVLDDDYVSYENTWIVLKSGEYRLVIEAVDDYGLMGSQTVEVTIKNDLF